MKVLYIHHSGVFGGASRSLLEMINAFPANNVEPVVLLPDGSARKEFIKLGIETIPAKGISQIDNTNYGYYRGFRWLVLLREIFLLPSTYLAIKKAKKTLGATVEVIHINEITNIPSLLIASKIFKKTIVLHVRSLQRTPKGLRGKIIYNLIRKRVAQVIAIDQTVAKSIAPDLSCNIIHNGFNPLSKINDVNDSVEQQLQQLKGKLKLMIVGNILFMKGIAEFMEAAKLCKENGMQVDFIIVGDKPTNSVSMVARLQKLMGISHDARKFVTDFIATHELDNVHLIKFTSNITSAYKNCDVLCFPSHLNAVGRPVFEAAFFKKPSIVAVKNPEPDTVVHMETGICISEKNPLEFFEAIKYYYDHPTETLEMGQAAYDLAMKNFNIANNAIKVLELYEELPR